MARLFDNYHEQFAEYQPETLQDRMNAYEEDSKQFDEKQTGELMAEFLTALDRGDIGTVDEDGSAVAWVKQGILNAFDLENMERTDGYQSYHDNLTTRPTFDFEERGIRNTDNTTIRAGAYMGDNSSIMPQGFVNVGAHVGEGTMIDGGATAGSACYIGEYSHIGDGATIGGVLDPAEKDPVVIGDEVSVGAGSRITQGMTVGDNVEIGENTIVNPGITVYHVYPEEGDIEVDEIKGVIPDNTKTLQRYERSATSDLVDHQQFSPVVDALSKDLPGVDDDVELRDTLREFEE
ncbi:MAG: 2,3,4,5-tetrahydropyridine-2,6-dicarboxylate N-succinyltransferase [Candidatus Nanohaloarchaea archaeon]